MSSLSLYEVESINDKGQVRKFFYEYCAKLHRKQAVKIEHEEVDGGLFISELTVEDEVFCSRQPHRRKVDADLDAQLLYLSKHNVSIPSKWCKQDPIKQDSNHLLVIKKAIDSCNASELITLNQWIQERAKVFLGNNNINL